MELELEEKKKQLTTTVENNPKRTLFFGRRLIWNVDVDVEMYAYWVSKDTSYNKCAVKQIT